MATNWTRRRFLIGSGATAGAVVLGGAACSSSDGAGDDTTDDAGDDAQGDEMSADGVVSLSDVPTEGTIFGWISQVFDQGIRRPGYPADEWAEGWIADRFRSIGLDNVRLEPITVTRWEPTDWSLEVIGPDGEATDVDCFPVPFSAPVDGLEVDLAAYDQASAANVRGRAALFDVPLIRIPADLLATAGSAPEDPSGRIVDPDGSPDRCAAHRPLRCPVPGRHGTVGRGRRRGLHRDAHRLPGRLLQLLRALRRHRPPDPRRVGERHRRCPAARAAGPRARPGAAHGRLHA